MAVLALDHPSGNDQRWMAGSRSDYFEHLVELVAQVKQGE